MPRFGTKLPSAVDEGRQRPLVAGHQGRRDADLGHIGILAIDQPQVAGNVRIDLGGGEDLDHVDIQIARKQIAEGRLVAGLVHQVAEHYDDPPAGVADAEVLHALSQGNALAPLDLFEMFDHPPQALTATKDRRRPAGRMAERLDLHPIAPHQPHESQGGRKLDGIAKLRRLAEIHRPAGVDQGVEMKILLFQEHLQEELFQPRVGVPIDERRSSPGT